MKTLDEKAAAGFGIICNANIGFGIKVTELDDGRVSIAVDLSPYGLENRDYSALREFIETTAIEWLRQVAPHRLALGANDR